LKKLQRRKANKNILPYTVKDLRQLQHSYMPFIQNGGLYVDVKQNYTMGDEFFLLLTLLDEAEQIPLAVKVVWLAGKEVKAPHKPGVGVQFLDIDRDLPHGPFIVADCNGNAVRRGFCVFSNTR
jgi:type IV pilus assembly protein PilZ